MFAAIGVHIAWTRDIVGDPSQPTQDVPTVTMLILSPTMGNRKSVADSLSATTLATSSRPSGRSYVL
jgi:hypothetical protein